MMAALLQEGAGDLDATAFATKRDDLAARIGFGASDDVVSLSATMLAETRDETVELLRLALTAPRFDAEAVERVRAQALASIRMGDADPGVVAGQAFYAAAFPDHHYGRPSIGTAESVAAVRVEDLRAARAAALTRERLRVAIVGAIGPEEAGAMLDRLFGGLPETVGGFPSIAQPSLSGETTVIDMDVPQSMVVFGSAGISRDDPDFMPALVMDYILGGGSFSSRLTREIREKRGLTYDIYTTLASGNYGSLYMGSFSSSNQHVAEAVDILRQEWDRMANDGVTDAELVSAKRFLTGDYALRFEGNASIAAQLIGVQIWVWDLDYINKRNDLVEAVTADDVARVARRLLSSGSLTTIVVGRPANMAEEN